MDASGPAIGKATLGEAEDCHGYVIKLLFIAT
jgi:hypothetical protein